MSATLAVSLVLAVGGASITAWFTHQLISIHGRSRRMSLWQRILNVPSILWHMNNAAIYRQGIAEEEKRVAQAPERLKIWREQLAEEEAALTLLRKGASDLVRYEHDRSCTINASPRVNEAAHKHIEREGAERWSAGSRTQPKAEGSDGS